MKITNPPPNYINQTYTNQANTGGVAGQNQKPSAPTEETQTDSINLSDRTKELQKIAKAMETEDVDRQKYVADIKQKVQTGQYNVNAELVAEKIAGSFMNEVG